MDLILLGGQAGLDADDPEVRLGTESGWPHAVMEAQITGKGIVALLECSCPAERLASRQFMGSCGYGFGPRFSLFMESILNIWRWSIDNISEGRR